MDEKIPLTRRELLSCMELGKALTSELDEARLFDAILKKVSEMLPAENWSLLLLDEETEELRFELSVDLDPNMMKTVRLQLGEGIAGRVALEQKPILARDVRDNTDFTDQVDRLTGFSTKSIMCVPLIFGGRTLGVIEVINPRRMGASELALLTLMADYAAIAVENTRRYHRIEMLAIKDSLTNLYNTRYLYQALDRLIEASVAEPIALIFIDVDDFKRVVDTYGHLNGSQALQEVAELIRQGLEEPAFGVSYGGDEFVVVLPGFDKDGGLRQAEAIRAALSQGLFLTNRGHEVHLSASFGVAVYPEDATDARGLLGLADRAMFRVKGRGKNAVGSEEDE